MGYLLFIERYKKRKDGWKEKRGIGKMRKREEKGRERMRRVGE